MLEEYQLEIIALVAIVLLGVLYFFIKRKKSTKDDNHTFEEIFEEPEAVLKPTVEYDEYDEEYYYDNPQENLEEYQGAQEGSFGVQEEHTRVQAVVQSQNKVPKHKISKRQVPPHGKITKDSFKEFNGERILIAEDNIINQKVLKGLLSDSGIDIIIANDGQEALDILEKDKDFVIILMDAHMPRVDGFEATREIRKDPIFDHILIVALSGDTAVDDVRKMTEAGMDEHLEKPLNISALYDVLYAYTGDHTKEEIHEEVPSITPAVTTVNGIVKTQHINGEKGLAICGGDKEFYHEILDEFVASYKTSNRNLGALLKEGELVEADKLLLDIVGVTANIGADSLNKTAAEIKASIKIPGDKHYLDLAELYTNQLDNLMIDIKNYRQ